MTSKEIIIDKFGLTPEQSYKIDRYIYEIKEYNKHTNIVGKSTLVNPWNNHVSDSIQICNLINNKQSSILDMGTGAGIPGLILAVNNYTEVSLIDSNLKKIKFVKYVCSKLDIKANIYHKRIESLTNIKFDYLVSRALANLSKLFFYSQKLLDNNTILIFLKGEQAKDEINEASKCWKFHHELHQSISDKRGNIVVVRDLSNING